MNKDLGSGGAKGTTFQAEVGELRCVGHREVAHEMLRGVEAWGQMEKGLGPPWGPPLLLAVRQNPGFEQSRARPPAAWADPCGCWRRVSLGAQEGAGAPEATAG